MHRTPRCSGSSGWHLVVIPDQIFEDLIVKSLERPPVFFFKGAWDCHNFYFNAPVHLLFLYKSRRGGEGI